jgi:tRNA nucleotidyltransferase (CCA-adding enzyme)
MVQWDIGRLPVLQDGQLVGIVTRTDVLRHLHELPALSPRLAAPELSCPLDLSFPALSPQHRRLLEVAARLADEKGLRLYLVGGAVRDLLLHQWGRQPPSCLERLDLDLVVDGPYPSTSPGTDPPGWGLILGKALKQHFPEARLEIHGKFQTAALIWPGGFCVDIASARTEFYPYPASPPEVAMGSIHQDLYRRDFSINAPRRSGNCAWKPCFWRCPRRPRWLASSTSPRQASNASAISPPTRLCWRNWRADPSPQLRWCSYCRGCASRR